MRPRSRSYCGASDPFAQKEQKPTGPAEAKIPKTDHKGMMAQVFSQENQMSPCQHHVQFAITLSFWCSPMTSSSQTGQEETTKWVIDRVPLPEPRGAPRVGLASDAKASGARMLVRRMSGSI